MEGQSRCYRSNGERGYSARWAGEGARLIAELKQGRIGTMAESQHDVIVVGAGPVGLSLALGLVRADRSVLVLEKGAGLSERSRAPIIWPRTQEILADLGVIDRFHEAGIVRSRIHLHDVDRQRILLELPLQELRDWTSQPHLLICPQSRTERLLYDVLEKAPSAEVRFSAEVTGFAEQDNGVEVAYRRGGSPQTATAAFTAGCDGAHSQIRSTLGADFKGRTYRMEAALADVTLQPDRDVPFPRMTRQRGVATAIRLTDQLWRVILPRSPARRVPLDTRIDQAVVDLLGTADYEATWTSEFSLHRRISSRFRRGRIALAGDAAHLTSPVGGQGMNVGIQDAWALTRALDTALDQGAPEPLDRYAAERRQAIQGGAVRVTDALTRLLLAGQGALLVPALWTTGYLLRYQPLRRWVMGRMAMLDDPSRHSTI